MLVRLDQVYPARQNQLAQHQLAYNQQSRHHTQQNQKTTSGIHRFAPPFLFNRSTHALIGATLPKYSRKFLPLPHGTAAPSAWKSSQVMTEKRLAENLAAVRQKIAQAAHAAGRSPGDVTLVAVTKRTPADWARQLVALGQADLGENYPQELWTKADALADLPQARWHLIGHLQTNKLKRTLPLVSMIHAVDSLKLLQAIATTLPSAPSLQKICLQVNISEEESKHGWSEASILTEAETIADLVTRTGLPVTGLMTMAAWGTDAATARPAFARLRQLADLLKARTGLPLTDLSMGMSGDFEAAIAEGATHVRVGSALFEGLATS